MIIDQVARGRWRRSAHRDVAAIIEQHVHRALTLADDVVVLTKGRVALSGHADELGDLSERILPAVHGEVAPISWPRSQRPDVTHCLDRRGSP